MFLKLWRDRDYPKDASQNPGSTYPKDHEDILTGFSEGSCGQDRRIQPLCHLSGLKLISLTFYIANISILHSMNNLYFSYKNLFKQFFILFIIAIS